MRVLMRLLLAGGLALSLSAARAEDRYFTASDGVRLHYLEQGGGRSLLFIPGWTMPAAIWAPQIEFFSKHYRVIAFDPRSQGMSAIARSGHTPERRAQDIRELISAAQVDPPVIVGWSLAVLEALAYVERYGDAHHAALVLVDNSVGEEPAPKPSKSGYSLIAELRKDRVATVHQFVRSMYRTPQSAEYLQSIEQASLHTPLQASIDLLSYSWPRTRWRDALYATRRPVMYVVTPQFALQAAAVNRKRTDIRTAVVESVGHALFVDDSARFNSLLQQFIETLPRPG